MYRMPNMSEKAQDTAIAAYKAISDFVNSYRMDGDLIAECLICDHKLLQTYVIELFIICIRRMAQVDADRITAQNRDAVELCKRIVAAVDSGGEKGCFADFGKPLGETCMECGSSIITRSDATGCSNPRCFNYIDQGRR